MRIFKYTYYVLPLIIKYITIYYIYIFSYCVEQCIIQDNLKNVNFILNIKCFISFVMNIINVLNFIIQLAFNTIHLNLSLFILQLFTLKIKIK